MPPKLPQEQDLPTKEQARDAFVPARNPRQDRICQALQKIAPHPPQVLILEGGSADERLSMALWYAALLNCQADERPCLECPSCLQIGAGVFNDLFLLDGREESIKIATVRELRVILGEAPRGNGKRVVIMAEAQALGEEAANALLKSLEEPRPDVCFLLLAPQRERLLPTLVSRAWTLTLAWPDVSAPFCPEMQDWENALANFLTTGQGWFDRTAAKGTVDMSLAHHVISLVRKTLADALTERSRPESAKLVRLLGTLSDAQCLTVNHLLAQSQQSLNMMVNPALVLDRLATRLYVMCLHSRQPKNRESVFIQRLADHLQN